MIIEDKDSKVFCIIDEFNKNFYPELVFSCAELTQKNIYRYYKTGEIADQFRLFWFSISPKLVDKFAQIGLLYVVNRLPKGVFTAIREA